jgi:L-phenylalanine/L-methionine N-acetyltransferase
LAELSFETGRTLADGRDVRIRSARSRDARALARLVGDVAGETPATLLIRPDESTPKAWRRRIAAARLDGRSLLLVADAGGRPVGSLGIERDAHPNSGHVAWVGVSVDRDWRGAGVAGALLEAGARWAAAAGLEKLVLGVFPDNDRALVFYERHGFRREGVRVAQFIREGRYHDEVLMARFLTPSP